MINILNNKKIILGFITAFAMVAFATPASAVNLTVTFERNPLFGEVNFLPGDTRDGDATVTNGTDAVQSVYAESVNGTDPDGLGSQMRLRVLEGATVRYDDVFSSFLSAGPVSLSSLSAGNTTTYTFEVSFIDSADNDYQNKTLGFDLCVGFSGGNFQCGDTVVGPEGPGGPGGGGGSTPGGGGGGSGSILLVIFNEQANNITNVSGSGSATITWDTNLLSTSQVVYGLASGSPYTLTLVPPNFGYPNFTVEDSTKVINHSVFLAGLTPGETYVYRVVSRASPPTISPEHQFTVPLLLAQTNNQISTPGSVLGVSTGDSESEGNVLGEGDTPETIQTPEVNVNLAQVLASGFEDILSYCTLIALLILLALYLIWRLWLRRKYEKSGIPEEEILNRFYLFFLGSLLLVILIVIALREYCLLPVLIIVFVISLLVYAFRKFPRK